MDEGAVVVEHARHNSHDTIHSKITLTFSRFPLDRRCHHATKTRGEKEREKEREKVSKKSSLCGVSHSTKALSRGAKKKELIQLLLAGPTSARPRPDQTNAVRWRRLFSFPRIPRESGSLFCRRRATLAPAKAFGKIPSSTHRHKRERKREKQSASSSETDAKRPRATYHERNRFRRFRLHRGIDGFLHSFGEVVRLDVLLDRHIYYVLFITRVW